MNYSLLLLVFFAVVPYIHGTISDLRLCADPECRGALSSGITTVKYSSIEPMVLSFNLGDEITIYSKDAGKNRELWGGEIKGKRGYVPKRLVREMRVFTKAPTYQVPTELHLQPPGSQSAFNPQQPQQQQQPQQLLQPQQQQQPPQQQQQQPQQPQLYQQPPQQGGPQGNFIPYQQQPLAPNVNPQFQNNNQLPNQPIPMQHTPPLQQQQKPMMQQPVPPITTTSTVPPTTETQLPSEIMETDAEKPLPIQAKLLSFKEPPAPVLPLETSLNPEEVEEESEDEEDDGDDELDENEVEDSADNEESNDSNSIVEDVVKESLGSKDEGTRLEKEKDSNAGPVDLPSTDSLSEDTFQTKTPTIDPIIDIGDLAGVDSSAINSLHIRSIEDKIENPISVNKEPINSSSIADVPISVTSSETIKTDSLVPEALPTNQVVEEALLIDQETAENTTIENSSLPGDPVVAMEKESIDIEAKEVVVDSATDDVESKLMFTEEMEKVDQPVEVKDRQPPMEMLNSASEPIQSEVISSTSSESVAISDPMVENQQPVESNVDKAEAQETVLLEEPPTEPPQTEVVSQESVAGSSSDVNLSSSDVEKSSDETKTPGSDGSGGGFLDSALNWLGLSDADEPLRTEQVDVESADPAPLQQQIAAMNPSDQDSQQQPTIPSVLDGFCDTQDCQKLVESTATESIQVDGHNHHVNDHHHHHDNDGHGHHHHHHHHDDTGFGHGHSHIPGYIPGFRHHYKPPVAQAQVAPPVELPPVELAAPATAPTTEKIAEEPVAHQPAEQLVWPPVVENLNPLPTATEQLDQSNPIVEQAIPWPVGSLPSEVGVQESVASTVPEYIPVEEIFRAEMEKNRLLHEQQLKEKEKETNLFDWLSSTISSLSEGKLDSGSGSPANLYLALVMSVTMVAFLTLYYAVTSKSGEKILKAKISQLDKQLYESQTAKEETTSIQSKLTEYETNAAELRSLKEQAEAEKSNLSKRIATLERERDQLEKEVEAATETATEANRMFEELLSSQSENDQWQRSVEVLQQQLNKQQQTMENLNSSLCVKTAENETLNVEVEELRTESERYKVRIKTLQSDLETLKTSNRNYQQKMAQESGDLMKLKQEKDSWITERRAMSSQINRHSKEMEEWRDKAEQLKKSIKAKESDLAKSLQLLKESGNDSQSVLQLTSLVHLESQLSEANETVEKLRQQVESQAEECQRFQEEKAALELRVSELKASGQAAAKQKHEAETRLEVLSNYFKEKETQLQKELGTHEAKRAITEENVSESVKRILETEESLIQYKSQVETLTKEIEEQERSYKSRLATQEKRAHENWVAARQLERRLEETKQEAAQLRHRLTQVEKDKEALLVAKENGTANGVVDVDLIKPVIKRPVLGIGVPNNEDLTMMEHPPLLSPPIPPPPPGMELGLGGPPPPGMPFDSLYPPPHFIPPAPFMPPDAGMLPPMHLMPSIPPPPSGMLADHHRPPPLGMIATGSFDVDYRRELSDPPPPRRYPSPPRRYPSPLGSERSVRSDRSDRMDRYDDHFRPVSPYGRHGGRPRSVGRSRDVSPERPRSYSPLPSPLYPPHTTIHSPEDWDDGRNYNRAPMMRSGSLRHPPSGPKTSSPLIQPLDNGDRHRPQPH